MKSRFSWLGILAVVFISVGTSFIACDLTGINDAVVYHGQVVYINTTTPFPDLTVKVTDGRNTHCQTETDAGGLFSLKVRVSEIDGNYYLLAGDSTCVPKKVALGGYGQDEVDLGVIEVEGPTLPTVTTDTILSVSAESASINCTIETDGRLPVTARGVCYGQSQHPTIDGLRTTDGSGIGMFTSNLKNLEHNTIYYARAYATNRLGTAYGEQKKFTTEEGVPLVVTDTTGIRVTAHAIKCKGKVISDGGYNVSMRGFCWSRQPDPTIEDECTRDGSGKGEFLGVMNNLVENTTYFFRTYATNSTSTVYGEQYSITTQDGLAVVTTNKVDNITATSFMAYGTVVSDCDIDVTTRGFCYSTSQYPSIEDAYVTAGKGKGDFKSNITNLKYATTYYVRAYATNATGTTYGDQKTINSLSGLPEVKTNQEVTNIGSVKATCGGNVTNNGTLTVTARGICYGTEHQPSIDGLHTTEGNGTGQFYSNLKELTDKTTYYFRAYATTDAGTSYGAEYNFKTENGVPVVELDSVGEPTANSVTCFGNVTGDGGVTLIERGFCYSLTQYPTNTSDHIVIGTGLGDYTGNLTGLALNTTYYVRAYAVNSLGVGYSKQKTFSTKDGLPTVSTEPPTATATTITAGGEISDNGGFVVTERGVCYSTTNAEPSTTDEKIIGGKGNGAFNVTITNLEASTSYYIRAYATNENGTSYGKPVTINTMNGIAKVATGEITNITALTATGNVSVSDVDGATLQSCGICWSINPNPTTADSSILASGKQMNTTYKCNMSELRPNTTYYVRGFATTNITTAYSEQVTFKTTTGLPVVGTGSASSTAFTITIAGEISDNGGYAVTERGICYSATNSDPTLSDGKVTSGSGNGQFSASILQLKEATTYFVRAYATNDIGTSYGDVVNVITKDGAATVSLGEIKNITALTAIGSVSVSDAGGATLQSCGICWSINPYPTTADSSIVASGKQMNTAYKCNMSELLPNTTYYVRGYATTNVTTAYSEQVTFKTTTGLPVVETGSASSTAFSITIAGEISDNGEYAVTERGICYSATNSDPTLSDGKVTSGSGNGKFSVSIPNLEIATTYYVRAYATNGIGTSYGDVVNVITKDGAATVSLDEITNITALTATGSVSVSDAGGANLQSCGICWSINPNPTIDDNKTVASGKQLNTAYACNMSSLIPNTKYYVRGYATTDVTTVYSDSKLFTTTTGLAVVTTGTYTTTATTITVSGEITDNGGYSVTERGMCYSATNAEPTIEDKKATSGSGNGSYSVSIANLEAATTYYIRAYATNSIGTSYGKAQTVTTQNGQTSITTGNITSIKALTATGSVKVTAVGGANLQSCGICWSVNPNPTIDDNKAYGGNQINNTYNCNMTELIPNATYYVRGYAITEVSTTYGNEVTFKTTKGLPEISISTPTNVLTKSFVVDANVTSDGGYSITNRGICWSSSNSMPSLADSYVESGTGTGSFSQTIPNLQANTTYYIRAYATNSIATVYSDVITQQTGNGLQAVHFTSKPVSNVKAISATCSVIVDYKYSDAPIISEGCCWSSITTTPSIDDAATNDGQATTNFTSTLTNLSPSTTYYVRAYITTAYGTVYSSDYATFTTTDGLPSVITQNITTANVTSNSFVCEGEVTDMGDAAVTERGICWNTTGSPTISDSHSTSGSGIGSFTYTISGVSTHTQTYYVRAYATNKYGTAYGEVVIQDKNNPYHLITVTINGTTYMVYPQDLGEMTWTQANSTCNDLTAYGFSDWRLPSSEEADMFGHYNIRYYFTSATYYWTSTKVQSDFSNQYYTQNIYGWQSGSAFATSLRNVRPIRIAIQ